MRRAPRRACGAREHDAQHVRVLVVGDQRAEAQQVGRTPAARTSARDVRRRPPRRAFARAAKRASTSRSSRSSTNGLCAPVLTRISRQLNAAMSTPAESRPALERLDERRARARERIEHATPRGHVTAEELLDELRDVLAEVRVQAVHVLRAHALRQVGLGPREIQVEAVVDLLLGDAHSSCVPRPPQGLLPRPRLEGVRHVLDPAGAVGDHVEAHGQPLRLGMPRQPGVGRPPHAPRLDGVRPSRADRRSRRRSSTSPRRRRAQRPRRATMSSSPPASQTFVSRIR